MDTGAMREAKAPRRPGALKGQVVIADDFDETPPEFNEYSPDNATLRAMRPYSGPDEGALPAE